MARSSKWEKHGLLPKALSPCLMSKYTLWVILGPLAASTQSVEKRATRATKRNCRENRRSMVKWLKRRVRGFAHLQHHRGSIAVTAMDDDLVLNIANDDGVSV